MKSLLTIFLSVLFSAATGQIKKSSNCDILIGSLKSNAAKKVFNFANRKNASIVIIDTSGFFNGCTLSQIYGRDLVLSNDYSLLAPAQTKDTTPSYLLIYKLYKRQMKCRMNFFYKWSGALGYIEIERRGKRLAVYNIVITGYL
jgi:hypothetical protein